MEKNNDYEKIEKIIKKLISEFVTYGIDYEIIGLKYNNQINDYKKNDNYLLNLSVLKQLETCKNINEKIKDIDISLMKNQLWYLFIEETANTDLNKHVSSLEIETLDEILSYNLSMPLRCLNVNIHIISINSKQK